MLALNCAELFKYIPAEHIVMMTVGIRPHKPCEMFSSDSYYCFTVPWKCQLLLYQEGIHSLAVDVSPISYRHHSK